MADVVSKTNSTVDLGETSGTEGAAAAGAASEEDLAKERKRANDAYATLRRKDAENAELRRRVEEIERAVKQRPAQVSSSGNAVAGEDPEPDANEDPVGWMKWSRREDQRIAARQQQQSYADSLNSFGATSEAIARQQVPDYDQAMQFLRRDYMEELELTGELNRAAKSLLRDANGRQNALNHAAQTGMSEMEAAKDLCATGAWEWRRSQIVAEQREVGGNPALKAVDLARRRARANPELAAEVGWKAGLSAPTNAQGKQGTTGVVDDGLKELERKRNLRAAEQTTADVRDGGSPREKQAWTYDQLNELRNRDKAEYNRVIKEIAADADSDPGILGPVIRH